MGRLVVPYSISSIASFICPISSELIGAARFAARHSASNDLRNSSLSDTLLVDYSLKYTLPGSLPNIFVCERPVSITRPNATDN